MNDKAAEFDARYRELRRRFLDRCEGDLVEIERATAPGMALNHVALRPTVHRLAGAAGTFGFARLSEVAGVADDALMEAAATMGDALDQLVVELKRTLAAPSDGGA